MQLLSDMRYIIFFLTLLCSSGYSFGQTKLLLENYEFDTTYKIIGVGAYTDKDKIYHKELAFYACELSDLNKIKTILKYGKPIDTPTIEDNDLSIYIIKEKEILEDGFYVNPTYFNINIDGKYFEFDLTQLKSLSKQYPINYTTKLLEFKTATEFAAFIKKNISDPRFLCYEDVSEGMDGICAITIKVESAEKPVSKGWEIIETDLKKLGAEKVEDYIISYSPSFDTPNIYKYNVRLSKKLYDKLTNSAYTKSNWTMNMKEVITYWKK